MWILPKNHELYSAYAPDMVASSEDLSLLESELEHSLTLKSKHTPLRTWLLRWKRGGWLRHLFARTLKPSRVPSFETALTYSLAGTHANRSVRLASDSETKTPDTCGRTSSDSSRQYDLFSASSRTSKDTSPKDCEKSSKTWKALVTKRRGEYSQREKLALDILGSESTSWPTPTCQDSDKASKRMRLDYQNNLTALVFASESTQVFPTPTARDYKGGYTEASLTRKDGKSRRFDALPNAVIGGVGTDVIPGHLNPQWVEWLMGLPTGWTDLDSWGTE